MEQVCSVSLSEIISTLLLNSRFVSARDIVNLNSRISSMYDVDIVDDDIDHLFECVSMDNEFNFMLRSGLDYDSIMSNGMSVRDFLMDNGLPDDIRDNIFPNTNNNINYNHANIKKLRRIREFIFKTSKI